MPTYPLLLQSARPARSADDDVTLTCCVVSLCAPTATGCVDSVAALMTSVTPARNAILVRLSAPGHININVPSLNLNFIALISVEINETNFAVPGLHFTFCF